MEGNVEIEDDDGDSYTQTKRLNISLTDTGFGSQSRASGTPGSSTLAHTKSRRLHGDVGKGHVFKCLQCVLQRITPLIINHLYGDIEQTKLNLLRRDALSCARLLWIRLVKRVYMSKTPAIIDLYSIVFLALRLLNEVPIDISEYLHMMKANKVPFINATLLLPASMIKVMPLPTSYIMLTPANIPLDDQFYRNLSKWTQALELNLIMATPADTYHFQAYSLFNSLKIPQAPSLLILYNNLVWKVTSGVFRQGFSSLIVGAEIQAISVMYFVLKLYFQSSHEIVNSKEFCDLLLKPQEPEQYLRNKMHSMDIREIFALSERDIFKYCDWIYDTLVPEKLKDNLSVSSEYEIGPMEKKLFKLFPFERSNFKESDPKIVESLPLELVPNYLTKADLVNIKISLATFFCKIFGLKEKTLLSNCRRFELKLYRTLRAERLLK